MWFTKSRVYLDTASATPVLDTAVRAVARASHVFGNPGSIHHDGVMALQSLENSRKDIAAELACKPREVVFVSGGTEANNLAIIGYARKIESLHRTLKDTHWVVSKIEHPSVLECFSEIERMGGIVSHLDVDAHGRVRIDALTNVLRKETVLVSIGWANHEIGIVQDLSNLSRTIRAHEQKNATTVLFHTDAGQAPLYRAPHVHTLGVDILTLDSGKLYGPRGIGALYISNRVEISQIIFGGKQERGLRPGTENVALAAGFAVAFNSIARERDTENRRLSVLREKIARQITESTRDIVINEAPGRTLPHIINISVARVDCEYLTLALDSKKISVATKSACREGEESRSHVVEALCLNDVSQLWRSEHTIRISMGRNSTASQISYFIDEFTRAVALYRKEKMI